MKKLTRSKRIRIDSNVGLKWLEEFECYQIDYRFPRRGFRRLSRDIISQSEALKAAAEFADYINQYGRIPEKSKELKTPVNVRIDEALTKAIKLTKGSETTKKNHIQTANRFMKWLSEHRPTVLYWNEITVSILKEYDLWLYSQDYAANTIRHSHAPIRMASRLWNQEYPDSYRDVFVSANIKMPDNTPDKPIVLDPMQLSIVLNWTRWNSPLLLPIVMLRGLAGLRSYEAAFLRRGDISIKNGTISIENRENHRIKNKQSRRLIPVCSMIMHCVRDLIQSSPVKPMDEVPLFLNSKGEPWTKSSIEGACKRSMAKLKVQSRYWREEIRLPDGFDFSRLRHTFQTICRKAKADYMLTEIYVGHKPEGMGAQTYWDVVTVNELTSIVNAFEEYFENFLKTFKRITIANH